MINKVLMYCKRVASGLHFRRLQQKPFLLVVADSAYKAKPPTNGQAECVALRGHFIFLACQNKEGDFPGGTVQPVDWSMRKLHVVSRSAPAAELRNALEAAQDAINYAMLFHEIYRGPFTAEQCASIRDNGEHFLDVVLCIDAHGLFRATRRDECSTGTDSSTLYHLHALRSLVGRNISSLVWVDNRDMIADGLTKGRPSRDPINAVLNSGTWTLEHAREVHTPAREGHSQRQHNDETDSV